MSDLSDPTALPDGLEEAVVIYFGTDYDETRRDHEAFADGFTAAASNFAAEAVRESHGRELHHFETEVENTELRAELDGLRAQIEEALRLRNKPGAHKEHVLAAFDESPRGTVARIRAEALDAVAAKCASFEAAEFMRREAATLREAAGQ